MKTILLILLISIKAFADPVLLNKDDKAPYSGLLFSNEDSNNLRKELLDKDYLKLENDSLKRSVELYKSNENLYQGQKQLLLDQNDNLSKSLYQERQVTNWERAGYFTLGIVSVGISIYVVKYITDEMKK